MLFEDFQALVDADAVDQVRAALASTTVEEAYKLCKYVGRGWVLAMLAQVHPNWWYGRVSETDFRDAVERCHYDIAYCIELMRFVGDLTWRDFLSIACTCDDRQDLALAILEQPHATTDDLHLALQNNCAQVVQCIITKFRVVPRLEDVQVALTWLAAESLSLLLAHVNVNGHLDRLLHEYCIYVHCTDDIQKQRCPGVVRALLEAGHVDPTELLSAAVSNNLNDWVCAIFAHPLGATATVTKAAVTAACEHNDVEFPLFLLVDAPNIDPMFVLEIMCTVWETEPLWKAQRKCIVTFLKEVQRRQVPLRRLPRPQDLGCLERTDLQEEMKRIRAKAKGVTHPNVLEELDSEVGCIGEEMEDWNRVVVGVFGQL
mgnify:CR=1 FL=1